MVRTLLDSGAFHFAKRAGAGCKLSDEGKSSRTYSQKLNQKQELERKEREM
jgi:hypothetical protein